MKIISYGIIPSTDAVRETSIDQLVPLDPKAVVYIVYRTENRLHCVARAGSYRNVIRATELCEQVDSALQLFLAAKEEALSLQPEQEIHEKAGLYKKFKEWMFAA